MKEFVMIFRNDFQPEVKFSPDEMQAIMQQWQTWMGGMAAQGQLASSGNRLGGDGKTVRPGNLITNGPYAEIKEMISGYIIVNADTIDDAAEIAKGCPILLAEGSVEVRDIIPMNG
ncbi:MAG: transcription initiation protein [Mucilaginibacter sp.]|jgi:hypothetical protein|nr:transcription initiation protein [Mucilaginibacter sp.]